MKKLRAALAAAAALAAMSAQGANILYYNDGGFGDDAMAAALSALGAGYTVTEVFTDTAVDEEPGFFGFMDTRAHRREWDLVIVATTNEVSIPIGTTLYQPLRRYVNEGGSAILMDAQYRDNSADTLRPNVGEGKRFGVAYPAPQVVEHGAVDYGLGSMELRTDETFSHWSWNLGLYEGTDPNTAGDGRILAAFTDGGAAIVGANFGDDGRARTLANGFRADSFVDSAQGELLFSQQVRYLLGEADAPLPVPEPGTWALVLGGLAGLGFARRRAGSGGSIGV